LLFDREPLDLLWSVCVAHDFLQRSSVGIVDAVSERHDYAVVADRLSATASGAGNRLGLPRKLQSVEDRRLARLVGADQADHLGVSADAMVVFAAEATKPMNPTVGKPHGRRS
jgi:hypothetical protein